MSKKIRCDLLAVAESLQAQAYTIPEPIKEKDTADVMKRLEREREIKNKIANIAIAVIVSLGIFGIFMSEHYISIPKEEYHENIVDMREVVDVTEFTDGWQVELESGDTYWLEK